MKKGFTLTELLISIAMIGVLAAITVPTLAKLKPDETKAKYLKAYNVLVTNTDEILSDTSLYWTTYNNDGTSNCIGLGCKSITEGVDKYPQLLATKMNLSSGASGEGEGVEFTTIDGIQWVFSATQTTIDGKNAISYALTIDIDGPDKGNNCDYLSNNKPDQFSFTIDTYGKVLPSDPLGKAFLKNPNELKANDKDRDLADSLKSSD